MLLISGLQAAFWGGTRWSGVRHFEHWTGMDWRFIKMYDTTM